MSHIFGKQDTMVSDVSLVMKSQGEITLVGVMKGSSTVRFILMNPKYFKRLE